MRILNLTFLLLTILVILSAVDVGECGIKDFFRDFAKGFKIGWTKTRDILSKVPIIGGVAQALPRFKLENEAVEGN
ncbi:unnamed protein product [Cylicocyclus nassatus]|uniref:Uncharacterized protein n=1 Tax=Cylicocyclus nassatus TaxID=53992 RepID=A0AA36MAQ2_CYLNA|nr:unnamed protein product [Cylicocyclus nassatus]